MEEIKNKNNKTKNESEVLETTNPYILELCDDQGNKKIVPVLPVANFTELASNTFTNTDNTCMTNRVLFDQLDPLWALTRPRGFHPIDQKQYEKLKLENEQILTFFGCPSDFFARIKKKIEDLYGGTIKFINKNGSGKIRILNSFFLGNGDNDTTDVDPNLKNNIIFNFVKGTDYEIKNSNGDESFVHRTVSADYSNGTTRDFYLPTFIDKEEVPRSDDDRFRENKVFWKNMNQILEKPIYKNSQPSDFDFIENLINYDDFSTIKEEGDDSTEYFAIVEKQESCKTVEDPEKNFCKGARDLVDNILKSAECKVLIEKGLEISKSSIYDALMNVSSAGCETTLVYYKIVPEKLKPKLNLDDRIKSAKEDFLDAIKQQIARKHKVRIYKQKNEIWDWEDKVVDENNIYSITNYWQAVISSVFLKFRYLESQERQTIFKNFVECYKTMKSKNLDIEDYFFEDLNSNFGYKTPILIKKLLENTNLALNEKDWGALAKSIASIFEMLNFAEHVTQMFFFEKLESKNKFDDLFLLHNNKLIVQIPELVKLWLKKYVLPTEHYKYNCLVDTELIQSDGSNSVSISSGEISKISKFKFHYDGLPYIFGISRESLKRFIDNFEIKDYGFKTPGAGKCIIVENRKKYYLGIKEDISELEAKQYIKNIICSLLKIDVDRLYYLDRILPENFWSKSGFIDCCFDYCLFKKNSFGVSDLEKINSIIKIAGRNYSLLDKVFKRLLTSKNISPSLILDVVRTIFNNYSQKVFDYKKMINENAENHKNIECVLSYKTYSYYKKLSKSNDTVKLIKITLNGYLLEINKHLNENSTSKVELFIEKTSNYMYDCESLKPVEIVFSGDKLSLNEVDEPIKLETKTIPGLENDFKIFLMKLEMNYYKTVFIKFLKKALSSSSYKRDVFESINNFLIERNKSEPNLFDALENAFSRKERANLFKYFSLKSENFILDNLDFCFVRCYISEISKFKTIKKIILETQNLPDETANELLKKLIKFNPKFLEVLPKIEAYKSAKESYDFKKIKEESKERKEKVVVADYSNNYHTDLFGDTYTDSDELSESEKTENTKHNIKEENNCLEQKKSIQSYIHNLIYKYEKSKNDRPNNHDVNEEERK